jgi:hypothetical protein
MVIKVPVKSPRRCASFIETRSGMRLYGLLPGLVPPEVP